MKFWRHRHRPISFGFPAAFLGFSLAVGAYAQDDAAEPATPDSDPTHDAATDAVTAAAADARSAPDAATSAVLDRFIANVRDLSARFEQLDFDADGVLIERSSGEFLLLRPDRYVWRYETPDEVVIVADGQALWNYDVILEQVTRIPLSEMASGPAGLLSGETAVSDEYLIRELPEEGDGVAVELVPFAGDSEFRSITIGFRDDVPTTLELIDPLGERTRIEFSSVVVNDGIDEKRFEFTPPRGVDVIDWN